MVVLWVLLLVVVALVVYAGSRVKIVPAGHVGVVTRQATYLRMVTAGLLWLAPRDRVTVVSSTDQQVTATPSLAGADGRSVEADLRVVFRVDDPVRYLTAVDDASYAVEREAVAALREFAARTPAVELPASSVRAAESVQHALRPTLRRWGMAIQRVEVVVRGGA